MTYFAWGCSSEFFLRAQEGNFPPRWGGGQTEFGPENVGESDVSLGMSLPRIGGLFERSVRYTGRLAAAGAGADRALTASSSHVVTN